MQRLNSGVKLAIAAAMFEVIAPMTALVRAERTAQTYAIRKTN